MICETVEELTPIIGTRPACRAVGASVASVYRRRTPPEPRPPRPRPTPARALSEPEQEAVLEKRLCDRVLSCIRTGGLTVTYWDSETRHYGTDPWVHVRLRDKGVVRRMLTGLDLAIGEGYMNGEIDVIGDLADIGRLARANRAELAPWAGRPTVRARPRRQSKRTQTANVRHHYDLGNDFYRLWLDESMTYSCAYFRGPSDSLERAQRQKVDHVLRKLDLRPGMRLLDIGCGWGELIISAARTYGVRAHGITLSNEQLTRTSQRIHAEGLGDAVSVAMQHYDDLPLRDQYDRVVSIGMYEHVGPHNDAAYMDAVDRALAPGGISLLHTITRSVTRRTSPWIDRYIFPGGYLPTLESIFALLPGRDFHPFDFESLRRHYALTLDEWSRRYEAAIGTVRAMFGERFVRMWRLYLRGSFCAFSYGQLDLAQLMWTKGMCDSVPMTRDYIYSGHAERPDSNGASRPDRAGGLLVTGSAAR